VGGGGGGGGEEACRSFFDKSVKKRWRLMGKIASSNLEMCITAKNYIDILKLMALEYICIKKLQPYNLTGLSDCQLLGL